MTSRIDIVLFGATGFTGKFVAIELAKKAKNENFTWAVAGRSEFKLNLILNSVSEETGIDVRSIETVVVDINNEDSVRKMCEKSKVIINCVGPYRFYGEQVVRQCVETGTHHIDVCGEPEFLEKMQLNYDSKAIEKEIFIIGSCGADSVPADLGLVYTKNQFSGDLNHVDSFLSLQANGGNVQVNFATWESAVHGLAHSRSLGPIRRQIFKNKIPQSSYKPPKRGNLYFFDDRINKYALPFMGADKSVVQRTEHFNYNKLNQRSTVYNAYFTLDKLSSVYKFAFWGFIMQFLVKYKFGRHLLLKYYKFFTRGLVSKSEMTAEQMKDVTFTMEFFGKGWKNRLQNTNEQHNIPPDQVIVTRVSGPEPGYISTSRIVTHCAIVVLRESDKMPVKGGVITPGFAFSKTSLIDRLNKDGILFENLSKVNANL